MKQSEWDDFTRLWGLKLATAVWLVATVLAYPLLALATQQAWWPYSVLETVGSTSGVRVWIYCFAAGGLGSAVFALRGFYQAVGPQRSNDPRYRYDPNWTFWYFVRPILGGPLGLIGYGATRVVLTPLDVPPPTSETAELAFASIAFLCGLGATSVLNWASNAVDSIFPSPSGGRQ